MFSLMGNCISCIKQRREPKRDVTLAILGLDGAGKTTITKALLGETLETAPTIGFNREELTFGRYDITLYDLGGGRRIRDIWKNYLAEVYGIIYVVDSTAHDRMAEVRENLQLLLEHGQAQEKPLLILANKQDLSGRMDEVDMSEKLDIEKLVNTNKCPCKLEMCSAIKGSGKTMDTSISNGMSWLCGILDQLYDKLKGRIEGDVQLTETIRQTEAIARKARVKKVKEERERKEEEERQRLGIEKVEEEEEEDITDGGPWKRLDSDEVKRQEDRYNRVKQKDKDKKEKLRQLDERESKQEDTNANADDDLVLRVPRSSRSLLSYGLQKGEYLGSQPPAHQSDEDDSNDYTQNSFRKKLPPLQSPLGTTFMEDASDKQQKISKKHRNQIEHVDNKLASAHSDKLQHSMASVSRINVVAVNSNEDGVPMSELTKRNNSKNKNVYVDDDEQAPVLTESGRKKKGKKKASRFSSQDDDFDTLRRSQNLEEDLGSYHDENKPPSHRHSGVKLKPLQGPEYDDHERSTTPVKKLKKKKNHLRKNKLAPSDEEYDATDAQNSPKKANPWVKSTSPHTPISNGDDKELAERWQMTDLGDVDQLESVQQARHSFDRDDNTIL